MGTIIMFSIWPNLLVWKIIEHNVFYLEKLRNIIFMFRRLWIVIQVICGKLEEPHCYPNFLSWHFFLIFQNNFFIYLMFFFLVFASHYTHNKWVYAQDISGRSFYYGNASRHCTNGFIETSSYCTTLDCNQKRRQLESRPNVLKT